MDQSTGDQTIVKKEPIETSTSEVPVVIPPNHKLPKFLFPVLLGVVVFLIIGAVAWVGYQKSTVSKQPQEQPKKMYSGPIAMSAGPWPGYLPFYVAQQQGYFKEAGVDFQLKTYNDLDAEQRDYKSGKLLAKGNINITIVKDALEGINHQAVLVIDYSNGADGIVAAPPITDFSQIKGKKVGYQFGTLEELFLMHALTEYHLTLKDVDGVNLDPEKVAQAFIDKKVDVAVTYEPFLSDAITKGHGTKIYSSADAPGLIADVLTFNKKLIDEYPDTIEAILRAYFKGLDYFNKHPQEGYQLYANKFNTTPSDVENQLKEIKILNEVNNKTAFTFGPGLDSLYGDLRNVGKFINGNNDSNTKKPIDTDSLINSTFINKIVN